MLSAFFVLISQLKYTYILSNFDLSVEYVGSKILLLIVGAFIERPRATIGRPCGVCRKSSFIRLRFFKLVNALCT